MYLVPWETTQRPKPDRNLQAPPALFWLAESELASHVQTGAPSAFWKPLSRSSMAALNALPMNLRFASMSPPLVLYHGTSGPAAARIASAGFMPGMKPAMLGCGIYLARFDKAHDFAVETSDRKVREPCGAVVRVLVFAPSCTTMTRDKTCTCGCAQAFVDHEGKLAEGTAMTFVPDDSLPATRRAAWCVRDHSCVLVDGPFQQH